MTEQGSTKSAHEILRQTEAMINSLGEGLIVMDEHGDITTINSYALASLGYEAEELIGAWFPGAIVSVDQYAQPTEQLAQPLIRALTSGQTVSDYTYYIRKDGSPMPVFVTVSPIILGDKPTGVIEVFRDLTKERQLDIAKDEFVSLASHQLRTPATGVKLILAMLAAGDFGPLTNIQQKYLQKAIQSNDRQLHIIEDLLNVARVDAGKMELDFEYTDLVQIVEDAINEHATIIQSRHQAVQLIAPRQLLMFIDIQKIRMAIDNLISNASKYTEPGGKITITLGETGDTVTVAVKDDGVGISQADIRKLFTKFTRIENLLSTTVGGTGLGLFLIKNIVELHQGTIVVESEEGIGSTFSIQLPQKRKNLS